MIKTQLHIGATMQDVGARFIDAWKRMERGEDVREKHVSRGDWETWDAMMRVAL